MSHVLPVSSAITCGTNQKKYVIESLLGSGGMGYVYKVHLAEDETQIFAMKTEDNGWERIRQERLKVEREVLEAIQSTPDSLVDKSHFLRMYTRGKTFLFKFIVLDIVGPTLKDIYEKMLKNSMHDHCIYTIGRQTLQAIESLHAIGWIHGNIKPASFSVGLPPRDTVVYMQKFGLARKYREADGRLRVPRSRCAAFGSILYRSLRNHSNQEQSRRDDLEAWMYMMLEFYWTGNITWWILDNDQAKMIKCKTEVLEKCRELYDRQQLKVPKPFLKIIESIANMTYTDGADFAEFYRIFDDIIVEDKLDMNKPLDWIERTIPETQEKPKGDD